MGTSQTQCEEVHLAIREPILTAVLPSLNKFKAIPEEMAISRYFLGLHAAQD